MKDTLAQRALDYHRQKPAGKLKIVATKPLSTQEDLALAYSPGVAAACEVIVADPREVATVTARSNLVAVISNGTAVLGLGNIGPLAAKPVMEGKAVLFKKFAGIDVFDIEIDENDPEKLIEIIASLEPTFGGINLEDIKAPDCFKVEQDLIKRLKIPVFHDDQHGTAIIVAAAFLNAVKIQGKTPGSVKLVCSGAGAAALACLDILCHLGLQKENVIVCDQAGVIYRGRHEKMDPFKEKYAAETQSRTLGEAIVGADVFLGLSAAGVLKAEMIKAMADKPVIFGLANPEPEVRPEVVLKVRKDAIIATGRSDYPNQVNNVLCFPYIFRGALDVGATTINMEMKLACVRALAELAMTEAPDVVAAVYQNEELKFGPNYIIPKPFDPRLVMLLAPAVAEAAMKTGVATRPIEDMDLYREKLSELVFRSSFVMRPVFNQAKSKQVRVAYGDGEDERVLRAVQTVVDEKLASPILIGRREVIDSRLKRMGLTLEIDKDFEVVDPENDFRYHKYWTEYHKLMERKGTTPDFAKTVLRTNTSVIANLMVHFGEADAALIGPVGRYERHLQSIQDIIGLLPGVEMPAALSVMALEKGVFFICDPYVNADPTPSQLAEITTMAAEQVRRFGISPKIALLSHSNFGTSCHPSAEKMRETLRILEMTAPHLEVEGEMHGDAAISETLRKNLFPNTRLQGQANLLIMPNIDAANITVNLLKSVADGQPIGPILMGTSRAVHILTPSVSTRGIVNMTAIAAVDAQVHDGDCETMQMDAA
ncbi:NADP-dependent malic enzyme [Candidatus Bealeia paramacronuclearis]|uniref:NADP-dependent malic enzyme n=1 Tax=Candidatus Bealeia paramacronuclearis TaxID=1921001 RepID=A0ABZ2C5G7_9PROT|nr:NADP-dependent malic enzyme [Candidatus Bealeia paramacronuclearis]